MMMTLMKKAEIVAMIRKDVNNHKTKIETLKSQNSELRNKIADNLEVIASSKSFITKYEPAVTTGNTTTKSTRDYIKGNKPSGRVAKPTPNVRYRKDGSIDLRSYNGGRGKKGKAAKVTTITRTKA
tara:strand:+ start:198 stop:575 length:378 start_codon:yes stop_codon:yes gene_type:complete